MSPIDVEVGTVVCLKTFVLESEVAFIVSISDGVYPPKVTVPLVVLALNIGLFPEPYTVKPSSIDLPVDPSAKLLPPFNSILDPPISEPALSH